MSTSFRRTDYIRPVHGFLNIVHILLTHGLLVSWFAFAAFNLPIYLYVALSLLVSIMHLRAMSEWVHEASHYNLVPNKRWNDRLANALCGVFLGNTVGHYRAGHMNHHGKQTFFEADDPDTNFSMVSSRWELVLGIVMDMLFVNAIRGYLAMYILPFISGSGQPGARLRVAGVWSVLVIMIVHVGLIAALFLTARLDAYILYYVAVLTLYPLFNRIRAYGQHVQIDAAGRGHLFGSETSRTIDAGIMDRLLFTSRVMMYHWEHHRHPNLPWRALQAMSETNAGANRSDMNQYSKSRWLPVTSLFLGLKARAGT